MVPTLSANSTSSNVVRVERSSSMLPAMANSSRSAASQPATVELAKRTFCARSRRSCASEPRCDSKLLAATLSDERLLASSVPSLPVKLLAVTKARDASAKQSRHSCAAFASSVTLDSTSTLRVALMSFALSTKLESASDTMA